MVYIMFEDVDFDGMDLMNVLQFLKDLHKRSIRNCNSVCQNHDNVKD